MTSPNLIILYVKDPVESASFYRNLLNREPAVEAPNFVAFPLEGCGSTLLRRQRPSVKPPS
ncbi:drug:proton antiporter, partial [Rhizobium ruizarguesonis]